MQKDVRARVLADHENLRCLVGRVADLARRVSEGETRVLSDLRQRGLELHRCFEEHLEMEDHALVPALENAGDEGRELACRVVADHAGQRLLLDYIVRRLEDATRPARVVGQDLMDFTKVVLGDMEDEERTVLSGLLGPPGSPSEGC